MSTASSKTLHVYLKVAERCNINCSYCYYFNKGNNDFEDRDAYMKEDTMVDVASFLARGVRAGDFGRVNVSIHGGEPLLIKRHRFDLLCRLLRDHVGPAVALDIAVQTNATLVDDAWVDLFAAHGVAPAASLDGPQGQNDVYRLDHGGRSTYEATRRGIGLLVRALEQGRIRRFGVLVVVDSSGDGRVVYRHLVDELGVKAMDFILPEGTHERVDQGTLPGFTAYLTGAFDEWCKDNNPRVNVRTFSNLLYVMANGEAGVARAAEKMCKHHDLTIHSTGEIALDDRIRLVNPELSRTRLSVKRNELSDLLGSTAYAEVESIHQKLPSQCAGCGWTNTCRGGDLQNRFSNSRGFNNPSAYCNTIMALNHRVADFLLSHGTSLEDLKVALTWCVDQYPVMDERDFRFRSQAIRMMPAAPDVKTIVPVAQA